MLFVLFDDNFSFIADIDNLIFAFKRIDTIIAVGNISKDTDNKKIWYILIAEYFHTDEYRCDQRICCCTENGCIA